ncbi:MAG TPA: glycosyltransferase [Bacteroidia bacterium]
MKILLLGDFSTVNLNLKYGLELLGHEAMLVSHGDGFKSLDTDVKVYARKQGENKYIGALKELKSHYQVSKQLKGFDIVQTAAHFFFHNRIDKYLFPRIFDNNKKTVLLNTACSVPYNSFVKTLPYSACDGCKLYDLPGNVCVHETSEAKQQEYERYKRYNAIVSTHFEYYNAFDQTEFKHKNHFIPVGIRTELFNFIDKPREEKINIYYGEIRKGFKGGHYIEEALSRIENSSYSRFFNIIKTAKLKYSDYIKVLEKSDILIDQASSYSYGVNALIGLAMGKVVMGGAEPEATALLTGENTNENPIINILPDAEDIYNKLLWLLENRALMPDIGQRGRNFVEKYHSIPEVAKKYEKLYLTL